jgi:hypothetical protein
MLRSKFISPFRSAVQSKGAAASFVGGAIQKGVSLALGQIPVPVVDKLLDKAWNTLCEVIRTKGHKLHLDYPSNLGEKVKFELKEIGGEVEDWDRYRWKIAHAIEQYNKTSSEVERGISSAPCDTWVRVWAKYYYMNSRIGKLRESVEAMRAILLEVDTWLDKVEDDVSRYHPRVESQYQKDLIHLKTMQVHDTCSDTKCMFKQGQWTSKANVPTSGAAKFFIKAASTAIDSVSGDPIGDAVDAATS